MSATQYYGHFRCLICFWILTWTICPYLSRESHCAPAMRWSLAVPRVFLLWPTTSTKVVFISTLKTFLAPCWAFSQWVRRAAFTACLTLGTLKVGSVAVAFPVFEGTFLIYSCCCHNSTIWFVSGWSLSPSFHCSLACWSRAWYVTSSLLFFDLTHFSTSKCLGSMKKQLCPMYHFLCFEFGTGISRLCLWYLDHAGQLTCVLLVWCHCTSRQCGSSKMLTLLGCQQWPWRLHWDSFYFLPAQKLEDDSTI